VGDDRCFLEAERFDRVGTHGRRGVVTLAGLDNGYYGQRDDWAAAADRMERDGWMTGDDAERLRTLWWFGRLIGNTDMHFANVGPHAGSATPAPPGTCLRHAAHALSAGGHR